jgi:hypothetical protein
MFTGGRSKVTRQYDGKRRSTRISWVANFLSGRFMIYSLVFGTMRANRRVEVSYC